MNPYAAEDRVYACTLDFKRQAANGDRYYSHIKPCNDSREKARKSDIQEYFYRAMLSAEAMAWLMIAITDDCYRGQAYQGKSTLRIEGHQGWASYRNFSLGYLGKRHGYSHLLEAHAPDFLSALKEIGVASGKGETDDISWGVGSRNSNGFHSSKETNQNLEKIFAEIFNHGASVNHEKIKGGLRVMAKEVTPFIFIKSIKEMTLVDLCSIP